MSWTEVNGDSWPSLTSLFCIPLLPETTLYPFIPCSPPQNIFILLHFKCVCPSMPWLLVRGMKGRKKTKKMITCYLHGDNESNVTLFFHTARFENFLIRDQQMELVYWVLSPKAIYGKGGVICWWPPWPRGRIFFWPSLKKKPTHNHQYLLFCFIIFYHKTDT